jgi:hypothetical protein
MTVAVDTLVARAQVILQDTTSIRWPTAELVNWLNDAQREIVLFKPDAGATTVVIPMAVGTKQDIPAGGNRLLRVIRNMSALSGGLGRRAVRIVEREILDAQVPTWHDPAVTGDAAHSTTIKHYCYDEQNPRSFYVYPGASSTSAWLEIVYSADPAAASSGGNISIPDVFANAILDYMLYRAYSKDSDYTAQSARATAHFQMFMTSVTGKSQIDQMSTPNNVRKMGPEQNTGPAQVPKSSYPYSQG